MERCFVLLEAPLVKHWWVPRGDRRTREVKRRQGIFARGSKEPCIAWAVGGGSQQGLDKDIVLGEVVQTNPQPAFQCMSTETESRMRATKLK